MEEAAANYGMTLRRGGRRLPGVEASIAMARRGCESNGVVRRAA